MNSIKRNAHPFNRAYRVLLALMIVVPLLWYMPGVFMGYTSLSGAPQIAAAASDPVIAAAGDIACDPTDINFNGGLGSGTNCFQKSTSDLLVNAGLTAVLDLGDNQYYCGGYQAYTQSYNLSWGRVKAITHPSVGNHEYLTSGGTGCDSTNTNATGYFQYFGAAAGTPGQGYYSFNIGTWHIIALNSNCSNAGGCGSSSPQYKWLQVDLAAHPNQCTLAYWHIPLFSSGGRANNNSKSFWNLLYASHADVILNGHDHIYERFAPQTPTGTMDLVNGIREFIAGTGGADHTLFSTIAANSQVRNNNTYGVLKLTLHASGYDWQFVPVAGKTFTDSGTQACHASVPNTPTPTATNTSTTINTFTPTATPTATNTPTSAPVATNTPTPAPVATNTLTPAPVATNTPTPAPVASDTPTPAPLATDTSTPAPLASTDTPTPVPLVTNTPTPAPLPTNTPTPALLPTNTLTPTPLPTSTPTPAPLPTNTPTPGISTLTFIAVADTYVDSSNPTVNNGSKTTLRTDGSPIVNSYIKFSVSGITGTVTRVRLLIFANSSLNTGINANAVADTTWSELSMTYNTAPAMGSVLNTSTGIATGTWVTLTVTGYITGNGTYCFGITDPSATAIGLASRESGADAPQLIIDSQ